MLGTALLAALSAGAQPATRPADALLSPYSTDSEHLWNRLHRALFVRTAKNGAQYVHSVDPFLYENGSFLLEGDAHRGAITVLNEFLAAPREQMVDDPRERLLLQHDLWAAFDYVARPPYPWDNNPARLAGSLALRTRLAKIIDRLALEDREIDALPDNYAIAIKSHEYPADHDPEHPEQAFLPVDLFDPSGPWVRFSCTAAGPTTPLHFKAVGGRSAHVVFLRLPGGREATQNYLKGLKHDSITQFPPGTMLAMVRRALTIDRSTRLRVTPITELVQIRVYRRIPDDPRANYHGDFGEQDVCEFVLDRGKLFAGEHGLHAVKPGDPPEPFDRTFDPFRQRDTDPDEDNPMAVQGMNITALKSCIQCHQAPGIYSVLSVERRLRTSLDSREELFRTYDWAVEMHGTQAAKVSQYDWGLLQGMIEATHEAGK